jgi:CheY-like chemotaxis protein/HPt (histidine-containing phosphotransfer) domain-containing protein
MGGTIGVDSLEGQGSTFWFTASFDLPGPDEHKATVDMQKYPTETHGAAEPHPSGQRILVADDDPTNREVILAQLKKMGYKPEAVCNGAEAVIAVQQDNFELVVMDCEMPVMDGFEATTLIHAIQPMMPIIALTASAMVSDRERCFREGMDDYLAKPVEISQLADVLARWMLKPGPGEAANAAVEPTRGLAGVSFNEVSLLQRMIGDRDLAREVLNGFILDAPRQLNNLKARIDESDLRGAKFQAHTLKGSAATVGAEALCDVAKAMETAATTGQLDLCHALLPDAIEQLERFRARLVEECWVTQSIPDTKFEVTYDVQP